MVVVGVGAVLQRALGELGAESVHGGAILYARDQSLHLMAHVVGGRDGLVLGVQIGLGEEASEAGKGLGQEGTGDGGRVIFFGGCWVLLEEAVLDEDVHGGFPGADEVVGPGLAVPGSMERAEGSVRDVGWAVDEIEIEIEITYNASASTEGCSTGPPRGSELHGLEAMKRGGGCNRWVQC